MDTMGLDTTPVIEHDYEGNLVERATDGLRPTKYLDDVERERDDLRRKLDKALEQLRFCHRVLTDIRSTDPTDWSDLEVARALGKAQGLAIGGQLEIQSHMRWIQGVGIESDTEGGDSGEH